MRDDRQRHGIVLTVPAYGHAENRFDILLIGGSIHGVDAGARLLRALEGAGEVSFAGRNFGLLPLVVTGGYALLFAVIIYFLWTRGSPSEQDQVCPGPLARFRLGPSCVLPTAGIGSISAMTASYIGLANGVLAGLLGIGGGILLIPIMLYGYGFALRTAAGTGIVVVLVVSLLGTLRHGLLGNVHLGLALCLMIGSALAAQVGASLTQNLPETTLRRALALVLLLTLVMMIAKLLR